LGWWAWLREQVYPRGGFKRATRYVVHRMRRLPDQPHRVARGVFAGSFIGFLPLPGLQFVAAWGAARLIRGNVLAALLGTFNTNPITTPFFAVLAMSLGHWILGIEAPLNAEYIGKAFANAGQRPVVQHPVDLRPGQGKMGRAYPVLERNLPAVFHWRTWSGGRYQRRRLLPYDPPGYRISEGAGGDGP
jgi:hypothetical protein